MIDILGRISTLRMERNWTEYQLAVRAELPQTTISSWYCRKMLPSIGSIEKLCNAFNLTLSQFFSEDGEPVELQPDQHRSHQIAAWAAGRRRSAARRTVRGSHRR
ncbi:MAG: helix-turn-helix transcriptional regulator [Clostridiales bacterium]|nr:helix-turn-helix transcriptional regulator [Clostridiales bacterium]